MRFPRNRPILVTGPIRSGTTWAGKMIASDPSVLYFSEPFNPERQDCPVRHMWHQVTSADARQFRAYLRRHCELRFPWWTVSRDEPASLYRRIRRSLGYARRRWQGWRPLLKDPIALMSAEWLANEYRPHVVVLVRHPAAFASSLKRLNWGFSHDDLLEQPQLMSAMLQPFWEELQRLRREPADLIDHAILGWRLFHHVIRGYQERHPGWLFIRHEDLSLRPLEEFARVFEYLELDFTPAVRQAIEQHTGQENSPEAGGVIHQLKRNSKANIWNWQHRLTPSEIARIRKGTEELAGHFYGDGNWWTAQGQCAAG